MKRKPLPKTYLGRPGPECGNVVHATAEEKMLANIFGDELERCTNCGLLILDERIKP